jgi:SAM-dependent methyltransferase
MSDPSRERPCWCGDPGLEAYSEDYNVCRACGTLVSRATAKASLYGEAYWTERQTKHHNLPGIHERARLDLPERCTQWLARLLTVRPPPARVLEVGCAHGAYVALLGWAGYKATGTELSPLAVRFAREAFGVDLLSGPVESLRLQEASFDVVVLNDVIEHLPDPPGTLAHCAGLLAKKGLFVIQTPEFIENRSYQDLRATDDLFLKHMEKNNDEHLFLFSRRAASLLFSRLGFPHLDFSNPVYSYDMSFVASQSPMVLADDASASAALLRSPTSRLVLALLDKARESADRWWAVQRLEAGTKLRGPVS